MARPLPAPESQRGGLNGAHHGRTAAPALDELRRVAAELTGHSDLGAEDVELPGLEVMDEAPAGGGKPRPEAGDLLAELHHLRAENVQLRELCAELEQALQEASHEGGGVSEDKAREYEALLDEKSEMIRQLHQQLQEVQAALEEKAAAPQRPAGVPATREEELLALSEELERERRQLQEDEQALMEQMRQMEVSMARERADMARQRNDLQRLQGEIFHELERLERSGALQSKIESLKTRLQDASSRRGASPGAAAGASGAQPPPTAAPPPTAPSKKEGLIGRLFGKGG